MGFDLMKDNPLDYMLPPRAPVGFVGVTNINTLASVTVYRNDFMREYQKVVHGTTPERSILIIRRVQFCWSTMTLDKASVDFNTITQYNHRLLLCFNIPADYEGLAGYFNVGFSQKPTRFYQITNQIPIYYADGAAKEIIGGCGFVEGPWVVPADCTWDFILRTRNIYISVGSVVVGKLAVLVDGFHVADPDLKWSALKG